MGATAAALLVGTQWSGAAPQGSRAPQAPQAAGGQVSGQGRLIDAATVVRAAAGGDRAGGLASIVLEKASVVVWWKGGERAIPAPVARALAAARTMAPVRVGTSRHDRKELLAASAMLERRLRGNSRFLGIQAETDGSGLVVKFEKAPAAAGERLVAESSALPDVGVPAAMTMEARPAPVSRLDDRSPWSGGAKIVNPNQGTSCTAGFGVNTPDGPAIFTAAHCGKAGTRFQDAQGELIGNVGGRNQTLDIEVVPTNAVSNRIYVGGRNSNDQRTVVSGGAPFIGEILCQSGNTSAETVGGPVCNMKVLNESTDSQRLWVAQQLNGQTAARPGDSGGPVYSDRGDGTVIARGTNTAVAGSKLLFGGFDKAQQQFGVSVPGGSAPPPPPGGQAIVGYGGKCVDVSRSSTADGTRVQLWTCNRTAAQRWTVSGSAIKAFGRCMAVAGDGTADGSRIELRTCGNSTGQAWQVRTDGSIYNPRSGRCLDVPNFRTIDGTQLIIWQCNGGANQRWKVAASNTPSPTPSPKPPAPSPSPSPKPPAPTSSPTTSPPTAGDVSEVVRLTNAERAKADCRPLVANGTLTKVAQAHSQDMATYDYMKHNGRDGRTPFQRMTDAGYRFSAAAENIAAGQRTPQAVVQSWMKSPGHRANILNCGYREIGVGRASSASSTYGVYWTQDFAIPR